MDNLIKVGSSRFKVAEAYKFSQESMARNIPFDNLLYTAAKFGGPIAITADTSAHILLNSSTSLIMDNIFVFYSNGELARQISRIDLHKNFFPGASAAKVVGMGFLPDETLFVLSRQGIYNMIDPYTGSNKVYNLREIFFDENIVQAKLVEKSLIFYTNFKNLLYKFYFVRDIVNPVVQEFNHTEIRMSLYEDSNKLFFLPIPASCSFSSKIECFVSHYKLGAYRLIEDEASNYEFVSTVPSSTLKKLPEISGIQSMALSPIEDHKHKKIAILNSSNILHVITIDTADTRKFEFKLPAFNDYEQDNIKEKKIYWCGNSALMVTCGRFYVLVTLEGEFKRQAHRSGGFVIVPELDSVRIFSGEKCEILKRVPERYIKIFLPTSKAKAADLYNAYLENAERNLTPENNIIEDKRGLEEGVLDLLDAAYFEVNPDDQRTLLRAVAYGKAFLNKTNSNFKHDKFAEVCKNLRVINALQASKIGRTVTYVQFLYLHSDPRLFMEILMKYQLFYLANEIAECLNYTRELISYIYVSWACCKIEQNPNDENIAEKIFERLKNDENASYVEVARRAFQSLSTSEKNRKDLALKIVQYEPSLQKKVTFLLWIEQYEQALMEASKSLDPNLVDLVILRLAKDTENGINFWRMVAENPRTRPRLFKYVYDFRHQRIIKGVKANKGVMDFKGVDTSDDLDHYLERFASADERASHFFWRCFVEQYEVQEEIQDPKDNKIRITKKFQSLMLPDKEMLIEQAQKLKTKNSFIGEILAMYKMYLKDERFTDKPVVDILKDKVMVMKENETIKRYKVSDRLAFLAKFRTLIQQPARFKQYDVIEKLLEEKNKKGELASYYEIVNLMVEEDMIAHAEKYSLKIKIWDEQLFMLKYIATTNSINIAIDQAITLKKFDDLAELGRFLEMVSANPSKYPKISVSDSMWQKIEKGLTGKK